MLVTAVLALLPAGWLGWTRDVSNILSVPLMPFRDLGTSIANWLMPPSPATADPRAGASDEQLLEELLRFERLYQAAERRVYELEDQIQQLQGIPADELRTPVTPIVARVTARNPRDRAGLIEVNRGRRAGVAPGTIAVYEGVHLVGRVEDVSLHNSYILPVVSPESDLIRARVVPADRPEMSMSQAPVIQLEPRGDGTFVSDIARTIEMTVPVATGDIVRLDDHRWPASAQAMIVGVVESIETPRDAVLRERLIVRPRFHAAQLHRMILLVEEPDDAEGGRR